MKNDQLIALIVTAVTAASFCLGYLARSSEETNKKKSSNSEYEKEAGKKAGEYAAEKKYEQKITSLLVRLKNYQDLDRKMVGLYAVGVATANVEGHICEELLEELKVFLFSFLSSSIPEHLKIQLDDLSINPLSFTNALIFAREANIAREDIDDIIDVVAYQKQKFGGEVSEYLKYWKTNADYYYQH